MSQKTERYLENLKKFYASNFDQTSVARIERDMKSLENIRLVESFKKHPMAKALYDSAVSRFKTAAAKLLNQKEMTQDERNLIFLDMDWAKWYIASVGGDPEEMEAVLEKEVEEQVKRLGLA